MANEAATHRHSDPGDSDVGSRQMTSHPSQDLPSHDTTQRPVLPDGQNPEPDIHNRLWTPFFLRRYTLLAFIAFYLSISAGLAALLAIDRKQQGLASAQTSQHYLWTYGPTAILTLTATLWGQVEYRAKQVLPWAILRTRPTKASETLFIDYVSINQISAFFDSVRSGHFPVTLAVLGSFLIRLLIVMSTSLLVLQEQPWTTRNVLVNSTELFHSKSSLYDDNTIFWDTVGLGLYNAPYPSGTSDQHAVPNLDLGFLHLGDNDVVEAYLPTFHTDLHCEVAENISVRPYNYTDGWSPISFDTPSCHFNNALLWYDDVHPGGSTESRFITHEKHICNSTGNDTLDDTMHLSDLRSMIYTGYIRSNTSKFRSYTAEKDEHVVTDTSKVITALQCELTSTLTPSSVMMNSAQMLLSLPSPMDMPILVNPPGLATMEDFFGSMTYFTENCYNELLDADIMNTGEIYLDRGDNDKNYEFIAMLAFEKVQRIASLLDPNALEATLRHFVQAMAAQVVKRHHFLPGIKELKAAIHTTEKRLRMRTLSVYGMLTTLAALIIITAVLCAVAPQKVASRDTDSIGGLSTILSRSVNFSAYFRGTGCVQLATIQDSMGTTQCRSHAAYINGYAHFGLHFHDEEYPEERLQDSNNSTESIKWWRPFSICAAYKAAVVLSTIAIIVALEILYRENSIHSGLANVSNEGALRYMWLYIPAMTMMVIQLLVSMIGSTSNVIFPYHELRLWPSSAAKTLAKNPSCRLTIHSLFSSVLQRHWAIVATSLSLLLNPFLTIISAGLYTAESIPRTGRMKLQIDDTLFSEEGQRQWADPEIPTRYFDQVDFIAPHLIDGTVPYPHWTHHGLVFPKVSILSENTADNRNMSSFSENHTTIIVSLNALRSSLGCTPLPDDQLNLTFNYVDHTFSANHGKITGRPTEPFFRDTPWVGQTHTTSNGSMWTLYGWLNDTSTVHAAICDGFLEEIQVDVKFALPTFGVLDVMPHEGSAHRLKNGSAPLFPLNWGVYPQDVHSSPNMMKGDFSGLFLLMLDAGGTQAFTMNDTMGPNGLSKLAETLQYYWRIIYPQMLNLASRKGIQGEKPVINGNFTQSDQYRLQQSGISTRILEVLLGTIATCVAISFWAMNTKEILPKNPCSIAAQASLLAGSSMLKEDVIPPGSEWCSDKELRERGVFDGLLFSMGWRGGADGEKRWFGIDVGKSDWSR